MKVRIRGILNGVGITIATLILIPILLAIIVYLPPVQNFAIKKVAAFVSKEMGMSITIESVRLVFPLDLGINNFLAVRESDSIKNGIDTIAEVKDLVLKVKLMPLLKSQVEVDGLDLSGVKLNTLDFISDVSIKGVLSNLSLTSHGIDLKNEDIIVDEAFLKGGDVDIVLSDTAKEDTLETKTLWKIKVKKLDLVNTGAIVHLPGDTLRFKAFLGKASARDGYIDLENNLYKVGSLDFTKGDLSYDNNFEPHIKGLDYSHIELSDATLGVDSFSYKSPKLSLGVRSCSFKEKSGILVESLTGHLEMDSMKLYVPNFSLKTLESEVIANVDMDLNAFDKESPGNIYLTANASIGKQDIISIFGNLPSALVRAYPSELLEIKTVLTGNLDLVNFSGLNVKLPSAFNLNAKGYISNLSTPNKMHGELNVDAKTYNLDFISSLLDLSSSGVRIPSGIDVNGKFTFLSNHISADMRATHQGGNLSGTIDFDPSLMAYEAILNIDKFPIDHFLPSMGLGDLTAKINVKGSGTDIMSTKTSLTAEAQVDKFKFGQYNLDGINFSAHISSGKVQASLNSNNPIIKGEAGLDAYVSDNILKSSLQANFDLLDLYNLKLIDAPLSTSFSCQVNLDTDLKSMLKADGDLQGIAIYDSSKVFRPEGLTFEALAKRDTTHIQLSCGDFQVRVNSHGGIKDIVSQSTRLSEDMLSSIKAKKIDVASLRKNLPLAEVYLSTGEDNPLSRFIQTSGLTFKETKIDLKSSPQTGLNGYAHVYGLNTGGMQLDTVRFNIVSDSVKCTYNGQVRNSQYNPQYVFNTLFDGSILENGLSLNVKFYDSADVLGASLGLQALIEDEGLRLKMLSSNTVIAYKNFSINPDNYIFLGSDRRISADLMLKTDDGMSISLSSNDEDTSTLQDLTIKLNKFDLEKLFSSIPYMPDIAGLLDADVHVVQTEEDFSLTSKLSIDNMLYEGYSLGNLGLDFVYIPKEGGCHDVNGQLTRNEVKVSEITGKYYSNEINSLDAKLKMDKFPMALVNGFIPDRVVYLIGYGNGELDITGSLSSPKVNGDLSLDSCYLASALYGVNLRLDSSPIHISGSQIKFNNYKMYSSNNNPLMVNGDFDFTSLDAMRMNLKLSATNLEAINAKENRKSVVYGKAYIDFYATLSGIVDNLKMQGRLDVLGTTDMSYILRDSPLTTDNQMDELVKFVNFEDSTETVVKHNPISGFTMDLTMNISQGARVMCYLNTDQSNYIDLMGGGTLRLQYDEESEITLRGKYTLDNGEMKYSLPIIPLKTFTIQDGSYIEFTGDPMNPTLNITATETTNANVSSSGGGERNVTFDCGVVITKTLSDMGLEFTLDAPEDMSLHNELMEMGAEQRGKIAVTMLTTGMYLADGETGAFSMNNALSSFLQSEINNITGNALRSLDLSIGFDSATDAAGNTHTDYSFKFAKRFWNNRLRIVVGGKVSTGAEVANQNESFFDNVTFEYRLGKAADKYLKVFYDNNAYDWLEGVTREYGAGFTWRRTLQHFKDIIKFKNLDANVTQVDSTSVDDVDVDDVDVDVDVVDDVDENE